MSENGDSKKKKKNDTFVQKLNGHVLTQFTTHRQKV